MVLPDLLAGDLVWPQETRIIGVFPFVAALAGLGIGAVLDWLSPWRKLKLAAVVMICFTMQAQMAEFFGAGKNLGRMHWGGNTQLVVVQCSGPRCVNAGVQHGLWGGNPALQKLHMWRRLDCCASGARRFLCVLRSAPAVCKVAVLE